MLVPCCLNFQVTKTIGKINFFPPIGDLPALNIVLQQQKVVSGSTPLSSQRHKSLVCSRMATLQVAGKLPHSFFVTRKLLLGLGI